MAKQSLTREQVLLAWAQAEAESPRFKSYYASAQTESELLNLFHAYRGALIEEYILPAKEFRLIEIAPELLSLLPVLPKIGWKDYPVLLGQYIDGPHNPDLSTDPRVNARHMAEMLPPVDIAGMLILAHDRKLNCHVLVEGYSRALCTLMRLREGKKAEPIQMAYCVRKD